MINLFTKHTNNSKTINYLSEEIAKLDKYFKESKTLNAKHQIRDKSLYIRLKQKSVDSNFEFIKNAQNTLFSEEIEDAYLALEYLEKIDTSSFTKSAMLELLLYKALVYELLDNNKKAKKCYNIALTYDKTSKTLKEYKAYQDRLSELKRYEKKQYEEKYDLDNVIETYKDPKAAQKIEDIAKYYIRSKKSLPLAQKYYRMCLDTYKDLAQYNPKKFQMQYILSLIKSVEIYKMPKDALNEAEVLIFHNCRNKDTETYLLNKINSLKNGNICELMSA